ncbi:unnamed protein product [Closterium sp. NIES-54]
MSLWRQPQQQQWSQQQQRQRKQHRWPQLQQWRVQLRRLQQPPQWSPDGPGRYTHRYVGAATAIEPYVSSLGACVVSGSGASEVLSMGVAATTRLVPAFDAGSGATSPTTRLSFTLDSGASSCFFRGCTDLTPLHTLVTVALADPSVGSVVAESTTTLPCPVAPSGFLTGYYTPSFSRNLVSQSLLPRFLARLRRRALPASRVGSALPLTPPRSPPPRFPYRSCTWTSGAPPQSLAHADVPTVLEPWLLARGGIQGLCGLRLHSDRGVPVVFEGAGGAVAEGEGTRVARARRASSGGAGGVRVETTPEEDTAVSTQRPHPASPPGFSSVPQFPPSSPPRPVVAEHGGVPAGGTGVLGGGVSGGSGSGGAGAGDTSIATPTPRTIPAATASVSVGASGESRGGVAAVAAAVSVGASGESRGGVVVAAAVSVEAIGESRGGVTAVAAAAVSVGASGESRGGVAAVAAAVSVGASGESRGGVVVAAAVSVEAIGESRGGVTAVAAAAVSVGASGESRGGVAAAAVAAAGVSVRASGEGRGGVTAAAAAPAAATVSVGASGESRGGVTTAAAALSVGASGESRGGFTSAAGAGTVAAEASCQQLCVTPLLDRDGLGVTPLPLTTPEEAERRRLRLRDLPDPTPARLVRGPLPSPPVPPAQSLSSSQWTRRSPLRRAVSPEPRRSHYRADGPFHLSSLTVLHDPLSDYLHASRPVVSSVLSALVNHPTTPLSSISALDTTVAGFASSHHLDYAAHLVSGPARSPSSGGAPVFPLEVLEDKQFELGFLVADVPHLCARLLAPEGDPNALDIPIPRTHAEAVSGPWALYWIAAEEAEMASYKSTGTYVDAVPPPGANVVSGMWLYKREGVDFFQTFAPTPKMTTLKVLLHIVARRDYELHSLDFSTAFLQGSLHEQIWQHRPPGFTGTFPTGTQWQLRRPVYGLRQTPREWHDTLRTTLAALDFFPSSADPSLFVRRGSAPFFVLVYIDDLVFATPDRGTLASVKEELQRRHTCTDLGEC